MTKAIPTAVTRNNLQANLKVATCSAWVPLNVSLSPASYPFPLFPSSLPPNARLDVSGSVDVWSYLGGNCTNTPNTGLFPFLKFKVVSTNAAGKTSSYIYTNRSTYAYGFTGNCSAPGNVYRNNATLEDNRFNYAWWSGGYEGTIGLGMNKTDTYPGYQWGSAPNSWFPRTPASKQPNPLTSIVLIPAAGGSFCCNINWILEPSDVLPLGKDCGSTTGGH